MNQKHTKYLLFFGLTVIYLILAYKNPFSNRSLVPNLEPYPDSLYYSFPAWSWLHGTGFGMHYQNDSIPTIVPPGYSWWLLPFFAIFRDVRGFYIANVVLQLFTISFLLASIRRIFSKKFELPLVAFAGWILISNFYFYTLPSLLMAENITITAVSVGLYLLVGPIATHQSILAGLLGIFFPLIKLSNAPIGASFLLLYCVKLWQDKGFKSAVKFAVYATALGVLYYFGYLRGATTSAPDDAGGFHPFSIIYFGKNLKFYLQSLLGGTTRYLWYQEKLLSPLFGIITIVGIICGLVVKKWRFLTISTVVMEFGLIAFMCFFYYPDSRYIFSLFPFLIFLMILPIAILLHTSKLIGLTGLLIVLIFQLSIPVLNEKYGEAKIISIKKQIGLNFRHAEDPWNYNAVEHINNFLADKPDAYIGTLLPPFYVEMFRRGDYYFLPVSASQEFSGKNRPLIDHMYQADGSIPRMYARLIKGGNKVYLTNIYVNNSSAWASDLESLKQQFKTTLVSEGCQGSCNIYQLTFE